MWEPKIQQQYDDLFRKYHNSIEAGWQDSVMNPSSAHQHLISNGPKDVFVNGNRRKLPMAWQM
ncbi:hypothetical protein YC2023_083020 [Brassica napus]